MIVAVVVVVSVVVFIANVVVFMTNVVVFMTNVVVFMTNVVVFMANVVALNCGCFTDRGCTSGCSSSQPFSHFLFNRITLGRHRSDNNNQRVLCTV